MADKPLFRDGETRVPASWANALTDLLYDVFGQATTPEGARNALGLGSMALQGVSGVQISGGSMDNVAFGNVMPGTGRFTTLSVLNDPVSPDHVANRRWVQSQLNALGTSYITTSGASMTGPLTVRPTPQLGNEAVSRDWVLSQLGQSVNASRVQTLEVVVGVGGRQLFDWPGFIRPSQVFPENFTVFVDGLRQKRGPNYTLNTSPVTIDFGLPLVEGTEVEITYINNAGV